MIHMKPFGPHAPHPGLSSHSLEWFRFVQFEPKVPLVRPKRKQVIFLLVSQEQEKNKRTHCQYLLVTCEPPTSPLSIHPPNSAI